MKEKLIVALDFDSVKEAKKMLDILYPTVKIFKIGSQLFLKGGFESVRTVKEKGAEVFLDLKLFDIPNTVSHAASIIAGENIFMFNVHALGGYEMMRETIKAVKNKGSKVPLVIAVTLLTSFDKEGLAKVGLEIDLEEEVLKLARLSKEAGLDGVVASAKEIEIIKDACGQDFIVVCPGIRLKGRAGDDQKRVTTPYEAVAKGADYIVVGRPITQAEDPLSVAAKIKEQIKNV